MSKSFSVWHEGEKAWHRQLDIEGHQEDLGRRVIRSYMPEQHRKFFESLNQIHLAAIDDCGHPWAVFLFGESDFLLSPDPTTLILDVASIPPEPKLRLQPGDKVSLVGLQFETLRRNRVNAVITDRQSSRIILKIDQSFGNCPKYIHQRMNVTADKGRIESSLESSDYLDSDAIACIQRADTFFIASRSAELCEDSTSGVDINHRGGPPGFLEVVSSTELVFPDYVGNNFHNTLGNLMVDNRVGLQVFDFDSGTLLNIKGTASIVTTDAGDNPTLTGRSIHVRIENVSRSSNGLSRSVVLQRRSPFVPDPLRPKMAFKGGLVPIYW